MLLNMGRGEMLPFFFFPFFLLLIKLAGKSGNGEEKGQGKGPDHDDIGFGGPVHFPLYIGILHIII